MTTAPSVLLADDDTNVVEVLRANLEAEGYDVVLATDGPGARQALAERSVHAAVLDVMMPGLDGLALLGEIRRSETHRHLPVVLLSAGASDDQIWAGWQAGANYYLTKPFSVEEILRCLAELTRSGEG